MNTRRNRGSSRNLSNSPKPSSKFSELNCSCALHAQHSLAIASGIISHCLLRAANIFSIAADQLNNINLNPNDKSCSLHHHLPPYQHSILSEGTQSDLIRPCSVPLSPLHLLPNSKESTNAHTTTAAFRNKRRAVQSPAHETESSISSFSIEPNWSSKRPRNSNPNTSASKSRSTRSASDTSSSSSSVSSSGTDSDWSSGSVNNTMRKWSPPASRKQSSSRQTRAHRVSSAGATRTRGNAAPKAKRVEGDSSISSYPLRLRSTHK